MPNDFSSMDNSGGILQDYYDMGGADTSSPQAMALKRRREKQALKDGVKTPDDLQKEQDNMLAGY